MGYLDVYHFHKATSDDDTVWIEDQSGFCYFERFGYYDRQS